MSDNPLHVTETILQETAYTQRWGVLAAAEVDLATMTTWDKRLPRDKRILVPVDVQAFVATTSGEDVVGVTGGPNDETPFTVPGPRAPGIHLHWAMPDALLRGTRDPATDRLVLPALPDRWVVIRHLYPVGLRAIHVTGWVLDATNATVTPLATWNGTSSAVEGPNTRVPLDGMQGGSPLWTAVYAASVNRFAFHDPLSDLPGLAGVAPRGFDGGRAAYTVAGWWSDPNADPLRGASGPTALTKLVAEFGWWVNPDGDPELDAPIDPRNRALAGRFGLDSPNAGRKVTTVRKYATTVAVNEDIRTTAAMPVEAVEETFIGVAPTRYHSLFHGSIVGVPIDGTANGFDERPASEEFGGGALGLDLDDVASALAAPAIDADRRQLAERLMAAFTSGTLVSLGTSDGLADLEEREHADTFWSFSGAPLAGSHDDVLRAEDTVPFAPSRVGRKGRGAAASNKFDEVLIEWTGGLSMFESNDGGKRRTKRRTSAPSTPSAATTPTGPASRTVAKAPPRLFRPAPIMIAVRGIKPHLRHHGDGLHEGGVLRCRYPGETGPGPEAIVDSRQIVPTLGSGAIPPEVLRVVREATLLDGYHAGWLAAAAAGPSRPAEAIEVRLAAEYTRMYGTKATYDGAGTGVLREIAKRTSGVEHSTLWDEYRGTDSALELSAAAEFARHSLFGGTAPSPVALTTWRQPWVPLFVEWTARVDASTDLDGWSLGNVDLDGTPTSTPISLTFSGRSPLHRGVGEALTTAMAEWLRAEQARDLANPTSSELDDTDEAALASLAHTLAPLDVASASLDGLREQLLGMAYEGILVRDATTGHPLANGTVHPLLGGTATISALRIIDAFGRIREVPLDGFTTTLSLATDTAAQIRLRPRLLHGGRWLFRLIDPAYALGADAAVAPEAWVDQLHPEVAVNPVSGFILPDHIDEACEVFDRDGLPLGQLMHESVTDAVTWEPAPGRPVAPGAGPLVDLPAHAQHVGRFAEGIVRADIAARQQTAPKEASALTALLRAVDSTLWSVDTYAALGSPSIAGLVGRPIAVVRATVRLDAPSDLDEVTVTSSGRAAERAAAFAALATHRFPVRIGELGRADDSVLGFFVDDDYETFHVVDKVVLSLARDVGRHRGQLGLLGAVETPAVDTLDHPYLALEDTVFIRLGETLRLTILMLPGGKAHLTSGILPRKHLALADEWVSRGLRAMVPSMRVGPVLVDPAQIRLPKVASFGTDQQFTRRTGPLTWRDDPIVAATSSALLPPMPHEAQEGWIRIAVPPTSNPSSSGSAPPATGRSS